LNAGRDGFECRVQHDITENEKGKSTMANDIYLQLDGIKGESTESKHKDWVEVFHYEHKITQPASAAARSNQGGSGGTSQHNEFFVLKSHDLASAKLFDACCTGKYLKTVALEKTIAVGASKAVQLSIKFENVIVSTFELQYDEKNEHQIERVGLNYGTIKFTYTQTKSDGSAGGNVAAGFSVQEGKAM
jgi:type VI secretion system secreted protein Hcp